MSHLLCIMIGRRLWAASQVLDAEFQCLECLATVCALVPSSSLPVRVCEWCSGPVPSIMMLNVFQMLAMQIANHSPGLAATSG